MQLTPRRQNSDVEQCCLPPPWDLAFDVVVGLADNRLDFAAPRKSVAHARSADGGSQGR